LGINEDTGVISGTPSDATGGAIACTINVTSVSYTSLSGSVDIQITIGAQIAKSLVVSGAPANAFGNVGSDLQQINLTCVTDTGITVDDAQYSASNLPAGLDITLADRIGTISGTPTIDGKISCIITVTSAKYGLFDNSTNIDFTISPANTLLISLASLQNNTTLAEACNLEINPSSGVLNKKSSWDAMKNGTFNEYLDDLSYIVTTIQFEGVSSVGGSTFDGCTALQSDGVIKNIRFVQDLTTISDYAFSGCTGLKTIDLSSTHITSIGGWVFYNCTELTAITIPSSLESISNGVFEGCTSLTSIDLSKVVSLTSVGSSAFQGCGALTTVDLSKTAVTVIGWGVFQSCAELTTINFPDSLEVIGDHAFEGCAAITTVDLSKTAVTSIAS
jgi:hypothetical protein